MNLICPRCHTENESDARFCKTCGTGFNVQPIRQKNSIAAPVTIIGIVLAICGFCGIFGLINSSNQETSQTTDANIRPLSMASVPSVNSNSNSDEPAKIERSATVITENANLRRTPSSTGEVIQTLPQDASIEVVRQQGAWFYVKAREQGGWMHGNTIRLDDKSLPAPTVVYTPKPEPPIVRRTPEPEIDNSGATAKCRDGTLSYSAHRRGTCSHHGGVAIWY